MWQPILTPVHVIFIFLIVGIAFVPTGVYLSSLNNTIYEDVIVYDGGGNDQSSECGITTANVKKSCELQFVLSSDVPGDLYVYYELTNFYQNHRLYVKSYNNRQLMGEDVLESDLEKSCTTKTNADDGRLLSPCGLIANSYFNDKIGFEYEDSLHHKNMDESNIAWPSDSDKFKQPDGFISVPDPDGKPCEDLGLPSDCQAARYNGEDYKFYYPDPSNVQYLYETYSDPPPGEGGISPIVGVTDEHFMVWFRTAARPNFRKLYGRIPGPFSKGQTLKFSIISNFEVASFGGTKGLVISTISEMGGTNPYLGTAYIVVGVLAFLLTILFMCKQVFSERRKMNGDLSLLRWEGLRDSMRRACNDLVLYF